MTSNGPNLIEKLNDLPTYTPPGHSATTNTRLVDRAANGQFEMIHGQIEVGGKADRHHHDENYQSIFIIGGSASVQLGDDEAVTCESGAVVRIPPGVDHEVISLGPDPLRIVVVYSPPLSRA